MAWSWNSLVSAINTDYENAEYWEGELGFRKAWAYSHWFNNQDHDAIEDIIGALDDVQNCVYALIGESYYGYDGNTYAIPTILDRNMANEFITAEDVDWKMIAEAWSANDFEGRFWTIALIDRMRQLMWNEPFNIVWAAKPEEQDIS